jgi:hypothetical protein
MLQNNMNNDIVEHQSYNYTHKDYIKVNGAPVKSTAESRAETTKKLRSIALYRQYTDRVSGERRLMSGDIPEMEQAEMKTSLWMLNLEIRAKTMHDHIDFAAANGLRELTILTSQDDRHYEVYKKWIDENKDAFSVDMVVYKYDIAPEDQIFSYEEKPQLKPGQIDVGPDLYPIKCFDEHSPICCKVCFRW